MFLGLAFGPSLIRRLRELQIASLSARKVRKSTRKRPARPPWRRFDRSLHRRADTAVGRSHKSFISVCFLLIVGFAVIGLSTTTLKSPRATLGLTAKKKIYFQVFIQPCGRAALLV